MARSFHGVDVSGATSGGPDRASARRRDWVQASTATIHRQRRAEGQSWQLGNTMAKRKG